MGIERMVEHIHQRRIRTRYGRNVKLTDYNVSNEHFWLLIELSGIRSDKIIMSLRDHLVDGFSKRESCERHDVSLSYFSLSLKKLSYIHHISSLISEYYEEGC
ncbi:PapB/FocB family fimbrial expression transcriptional regulator [Escherichia coli]|uniref:PapB/FocB family fimbrial expression transcriptional regulator n=2 Tax=Escherichia coli TaxID=562 RepID=UPI0038F7F173